MTRDWTNWSDDLLDFSLKRYMEIVDESECEKAKMIAERYIILIQQEKEGRRK